jgi:hypothetical protein
MRSVIVACLLAAACTPQPPSCTHVGGTPMLEYHLYFARASATDAQWADFTARVVTPHLPDGFTVFDADGQWMNPATGQIAHERTKVIDVAVPDTPAAAAAITAIKDAYRTEFHQQSVGTTIVPICGAF